MITSKRLAMFLLLAVFALGVATGALVMPLVMPLVAKAISGKALKADPASAAKKFSQVDSLAEELRLNAEQKEHLREIVDKSRERYCQLKKEFNPRCDEIRNQTRAAIMQILDGDQKHLFQKHIEHQDRERMEHGTESAQDRD